MNIGFSTGSIAHGDFEKAIHMMKNMEGNVIELSALRESELDPLLNCIETLDLRRYRHISFHAPSKLKNLSESELVDKLLYIIRKDWPIIVHPDIIEDFSVWRKLGSNLCLENMDKRKGVGRTTQDMSELFKNLPEASFCFDIAHVRQVDPTLMEGIRMIKLFRNRLKQLHISEVNSESKHQPLTFESIIAFNTLARYIPNEVPIVLESPVQAERINEEIRKTLVIFNNSILLEMLRPFSDSSPYFYQKVKSLTQEEKAFHHHAG